MSGRSAWYELGRAIRGLLLGGAKSERTRPAPSRRTARVGARNDRVVADGGGYAESPGQYGDGATRELRSEELARLRFAYAPQPDGDPDPGEVVWTWVPYAENDGRGKDRPVLIVGRLDETTVAGCYLSTKQHDGFVSVGRGGWDSQGRESFLAPDRVLRITHDGMRREGVQLDREHFVEAARAIARRHRLNL